MFFRWCIWEREVHRTQSVHLATPQILWPHTLINVFLNVAGWQRSLGCSRPSSHIWETDHKPVSYFVGSSYQVSIISDSICHWATDLTVVPELGGGGGFSSSLTSMLDTPLSNQPRLVWCDWCRKFLHFYILVHWPVLQEMRPLVYIWTSLGLSDFFHLWNLFRRNHLLGFL